MLDKCFSFMDSLDYLRHKVRKSACEAGVRNAGTRLAKFALDLMPVIAAGFCDKQLSPMIYPHSAAGPVKLHTIVILRTLRHRNGYDAGRVSRQSAVSKAHKHIRFVITRNGQAFSRSVASLFYMRLQLTENTRNIRAEKPVERIDNMRIYRS